MTNLMTPEFRVSWPKLFKPEADEKGKLWYSVQALFPPGENLEKMKAAAQEALVKKFGADKEKWPANLINPFKKQSTKRKNKEGKMVDNPGHIDGALYLTLKSSQKPGVVDMNVQEIINEQDFYAGCYARATVQVSAYDNKSKGVTFYLQNIQKTKEGEPLSGRAKAETEFAPIEGANETVSSASDMFG